MRPQRNTFRLAPMAAFLIATGATAGTVGPTQIPVADVPYLTDWNTTNTATVDPSEQDGKTFVYPSTTDRDNDAADGTVDGFASGTRVSAGYISWLLDNGTGTEPGIQVITDDDDFKVNNCIMASGVKPPDDPDATKKTCSNEPGSSKRYKLVLTDAFVDGVSSVKGVDLVFDTGLKDMTYDEDIDAINGNNDGAIDSTNDAEIGRIYRVIQKLINDSDQRIENIRVELGTGTGTGFKRLTEDGSPIGSVENIGFEVRTTVADSFFGDFDADDGARDVWNADEFAVFSPSMYYAGDPAGDDFRFGEGFFDLADAGLPATEFGPITSEKTDSIDSGDSITDNYFDLPAYRTAEPLLSIEDGPIPGTVFGYMLPESQLPTGIYEDLDGDPASEGDLVAWWDGENWRYGQDQDFAIVPDSQLAEWAARPLSEDEVLDGPRYEATVIDDLRSVNMDFFIYLDEGSVTGDASTGFTPESITLRVIAEPATVADEPLWMSNTAPSLDTYAVDSDTSTSVSGGGGGGCTIGGNRPFDPLLPGLALAALGYLGLRRRWDAAR